MWSQSGGRRADKDTTVEGSERVTKRNRVPGRDRVVGMVGQG